MRILLPDYKQVKVLKPFCPICKEQLQGDGTSWNPYKCSCGTWKFDQEKKEFIIEK